MTWNYVRNGFVIAHRLLREDEGRWALEVVDFDGFARTEHFDDEPGALRRQMALERALILRGWGLETFSRAA
ncbi:MAG: hypothetical protein AB7O67_11805 [Vicinamibacterales bacterium]